VNKGIELADKWIESAEKWVIVLVSMTE
jgi:hypothetical protein